MPGAATPVSESGRIKPIDVEHPGFKFQVDDGTETIKLVSVLLFSFRNCVAKTRSSTGVVDF